VRACVGVSVFRRIGEVPRRTIARKQSMTHEKETNRDVRNGDEYTGESPDKSDHIVGGRFRANTLRATSRCWCLTFMPYRQGVDFLKLDEPQRDEISVLPPHQTHNIDVMG